MKEITFAPHVGGYSSVLGKIVGLGEERSKITAEEIVLKVFGGLSALGLQKRQWRPVRLRKQNLTMVFLLCTVNIFETFNLQKV